jgi:hypothetical protein
MMMLIRCTAAALLLAAAGIVHAADWRVAGLAIGEGNRGVTYVDAASLRPKRDRIRFRSEQYLEDGTVGYDRISALSEVDCASMTVTLLRESLYKKRALVAFGATPRDANYYSSSNSYHWVLRNVCEGRFPGGTVADHETDSRRLFALRWSPVPGRLSVAMPAVVPAPLAPTQIAVARISAAASAPRP